MAARIAAFDWSTTALGPIASWPQALRTLVNLVLCTPVPATLIWGREGILIYNQGYAAICGKRHPRTLGAPLREAWPEAWDFNGAMLARGLAGEQQAYERVHFLLDRDGELRDSWFNLYYAPTTDEDGAVTGVLAEVFEITGQIGAEHQRDQQERALMESRARFLALAGATADVVYRMSPDWSEMRQLDGRGFLRDASAPGPSWLTHYIPREDQETVFGEVRRAIQEKRVFELEHRVLRVDGSYGWTLSKVVPMLDEQGALQEWIGASSDVTERKATEERLRESDRRKDEFLAMLAHELRNPLAPIGVAAELLQLGRLDASGVQRTSQVIGRQVAHMKGLIDDLLDVSRVTRGLVALDNAPLELREVIEDAIEQVMPMIEARGHTLVRELLPGPARLRGDRKRLIQVVSNLLNNAAKYTPEGGTIRIGTSQQTAHLRIEVEDTGIGMAPSTVRHAFDLFVQAERTSDRSTGGLGLGLSLVKSLVELHGGTVSCTSAGLGKGSCFAVCLPRQLDADLPGGAPTGGNPGHPPSPLHILVVDDNVDAAAMLAMLLQSAGHEVTIEHGGRAALAAMHKRPAQVCLIDIGLPDIDGNALARRLRARPEMSSTVMIAITGYGQDSDRAASLAAGFNHHLTKPVDVSALQGILTAIGPAPRRQ